MFDSDSEFVGIVKLVFINGDQQIIQVRRIIRDSKAHPIVIEDIVGTYYNWSVILSVTPVQKEE